MEERVEEKKGREGSRGGQEERVPMCRANGEKMKKGMSDRNPRKWERLTRAGHDGSEGKDARSERSTMNRENDVAS